jgi:serine/threonine-protein kinase
MALKAWDDRLFRHVVIKLYHNADSASEKERILFEGRALARVRHPFVCMCLAVEQFGDLPFLVLQYVPGETLQQRLEWQRFSVQESLDLMVRLCTAVTAIHRSGLLHCDLKPGNVVIDDSNEPTVIDLGLATSRLDLIPTDVAGTPAYLAPERANGDVELVDERCDVFGLGAILYELLSGRAPFAHESRSESRKMARAGAVAPISEEELLGYDNLKGIVMQALSGRPIGRFRTAQALADQLESIRHRD